MTEMFYWLKTIRVKLTLWYSFILLATLVTCGAVAYVYSNEQLSQSLDQSLRSEVLWIQDIVRLQLSRTGRQGEKSRSKGSTGQMRVSVVQQTPEEEENIDSTN